VVVVVGVHHELEEVVDAVVEEALVVVVDDDAVEEAVVDDDVVEEAVVVGDDVVEEAVVVGDDVVEEAVVDDDVVVEEAVVDNAVGGFVFVAPEIADWVGAGVVVVDPDGKFAHRKSDKLPIIRRTSIRSFNNNETLRCNWNQLQAVKSPNNDSIPFKFTSIVCLRAYTSIFKFENDCPPALQPVKSGVENPQ